MPLTPVRVLCAFVLAIATAPATGPAFAQVPPRQAPIAAGEATFEVLLRDTSIGTIRSEVVRTDQGWTVAASGAIGAPFSVTARRAEVGYTADWRPLSFTLDLTAPGEQVVVHGAFTTTGEDRVEIVNEQRQVVFVTPTIAGDALLLADSAPGSYEALAAWLGDAEAGAVRPAYLVPNREIMVRLDAVGSDRVQLSSGPVPVRRCRVAFQDPAGPYAVDVWVHEGRLLRLDVPATSMSIRRTDVTDW